MEEALETKQGEKLEQEYFDPQAPVHKRVIELDINDSTFEFTWNRIQASDLLYVLAGQKDNPDDTVIKGMERLLKKTVSSSQKGLLIDHLNNKANYTLARKLIEGMLPLITDNETIISKPQIAQEGDVKTFTVYLTTDEKAERFVFKTDRVQFDEFQTVREEAASDMADEIHNFLSGSLEDDTQRQRYNLLAFDKRNFTLSVKLYSKVAHFLSRNQGIMTRLTLKK